MSSCHILFHPYKRSFHNQGLSKKSSPGVATGQFEREREEKKFACLNAADAKNYVI